MAKVHNMMNTLNWINDTNCHYKNFTSRNNVQIISDKQYLYTLFMHKKSYKRTKFVTLLDFGIIPWNSLHLGKWYSGDASSMFLLIFVVIEHPLFQWAQMRKHLLYDRFH